MTAEAEATGDLVTKRASKLVADGLQRVVAAMVVCLPIVGISAVLPRPIALSAWLGTTAIALHSPHRYREDRRMISAAYAHGFAVMIAVATLGAAWQPPAWGVAVLGLVILISSPAARWHPPVACLPLAVSITTPTATLLDWGLLAALTALHLWFLGRVATALRHHEVVR